MNQPIFKNYCPKERKHKQINQCMRKYTLLKIFISFHTHSMNQFFCKFHQTLNLTIRETLIETKSLLLTISYFNTMNKSSEPQTLMISFRVLKIRDIYIPGLHNTDGINSQAADQNDYI